MSSIMDKSRDSRSKMFLRSNSFQRLCSLAHPMRLRGFKSHREALRSVFESLIVTTRGVIQSVTYRILGFLFLTPFTRLLSRPLQGLVDAAGASAADGTDGSTRLNTVRLILKLTLSMIISTDKAGVVSVTEPTLSDETDDLATDDHQSAADQTNSRVDTAVQTEEHSCNSDDEEGDPEPDIPVDRFFDCKDSFVPSAEFAAACQDLLESSRRLQNSRALPRGQTQKRPPRSGVPLLLVVYGCVLCSLGQLSVLVYMLNAAASVPPGLIFLISALAYIGYVMMRILHSTKSNNDSKSSDVKTGKVVATSMALVPVAVKPKKTGKGLHPILEAVCKRLLLVTSSSNSRPSEGSPRMSRSATRTRVLLCADDKTISKIKIL